MGTSKQLLNHRLDYIFFFIFLFAFLKGENMGEESGPKVKKWTYVNGEYVGDGVNGKRHGKGKYTWTTGEKFKGRWDAGLREGKGHLSYTVGTRHPVQGTVSRVEKRPRRVDHLVGQHAAYGRARRRRLANSSSQYHLQAHRVSHLANHRQHPRKSHFARERET